MVAGVSSKTKVNVSKTAATAAQIDANAGKDVPQGNNTGGTSIGGSKIGRQVVTGVESNPELRSLGVEPILKPVFSTVQYTSDSPFAVVSTMSNQEKADALFRLGLVPDLYSNKDPQTLDSIKRQGDSVTFRSEDYTALANVMKYADETGASWHDSLNKFNKDPGLASIYFGRITPKATKLNLSSPDALISDLNAKFTDLFEVPADKKTATAYANEIIKAETKAKGPLGKQQYDDIFNKYVQSTAMGKFTTVNATPDTLDNAQLGLGQLGKTVRILRSAYDDNGIPASDKQVYTQAITGMRSQSALDNALNDISVHASMFFPAFKGLIDKGKSVKSLLSPYMKIYSDMFGTPQDQLKVADFYGVAKGTQPLTPDDYETSLWNSPDIKKAKAYQTRAYSDLSTMLQAFGIGG